jgi:ornithine--oxo-acid transaminase
MYRSRATLLQKKTSEAIIKAEKQYGASNYSPLSVVFSKASGSTVTSPEGKHYLDFLSGYGAVSQGHLHPRLIKTVKQQLDRCTLSSRAFYSDQFGKYAKFITTLFKYDKVLPMNTGAEGVETALKLARKWGYKVKKIPTNKAIIVCCEGNFHGRTFGAIAMSDDPTSFNQYGPHLPGILRVPYGDEAALQKVFKEHHENIAGFICEPIQGEAGVIIPPKGYLRAVRRLCTRYNILYIDDEVQAGLGRTGKMLAVEHEGVRPDVVILAKALGGGVLPVAAVLADNKHMVFEPGTHGSTFGGNPVASALAIEALKVLKEEKLCQRAAASGRVLSRELEKMKKEFPFIKETRCRGLFCAVEMEESFLNGKGAYRLMYLLKDLGVLAKVTHDTTIRITPPLVITKAELQKGIAAFRSGLKLVQDEAGRATPAAAPPAKIVKSERTGRKPRGGVRVAVKRAVKRFARGL